MRKRLLSTLIAGLSGSLLLSACSFAQATLPSPGPASASAESAEALPLIGGKQPLILRRARTDTGKAQFLSVTLLPGRGMNMLQITADLPGLGETPLLQASSLEEAARRMNDAEKDPWGYVSYSMGGAFLLPWASRISGEVAPDRQSVTTSWHGHPLSLRINASGKYAIHGLIHRAPVEDVTTTRTTDGETASGILRAGDFGGHWLSSTGVRFTIALEANAIDIRIEAKNVGHESEPMAIGWHPYFSIPSRDRAQARLHVAADRFAETVPSDGLTTGVLLSTANSAFDFRSPAGRLLGPAMNVNFSSLTHGGRCAASLIDPKSSYGLCVRPLSPTIHTIQAYSPANSSFVAIEPQFNFPDPLGAEWKGMDTGMVTLEPGKSVDWRVRLELFRP